MPSTSHAVIVGQHIWVQGLLGTRDAGLDLAPGGVGPETAQACANISRVLAACDATIHDVVQVDVLLVDTADFLELDQTLAGHLPVRPARTVAYVKELPIGASVELTVRAMKEP